MVAASLPISSLYDPRAAGALCDRCPLEGRPVVPPDRARDRLELIVIGEGPGTSEVRALRPFVGPSGRLMDAALLEAGTRRSSCHVTNAVLCQAETEKELAAAIPCCAPRLGREVGGLFVGGPAALKNDVTTAWIGPPPVVVSLGAQAARVVIGKAGVIKYRGFIWSGPVISPASIRASEREAVRLRARIRIEKGAKRRALRIKLRKVEDAGILLAARQFFQERTIVPTVHPAFILRGADAFRPVLRIDLKRAVAAARAADLDQIIEGRGKFHQTSDPAKAAKLLARLGPEVTVDIETDRRDPMQAEINCVGVADVRTLRAVILDPWSKRLAKPLREALKHRTCVTHNGPAFDVIALRQKARVKFGRNEDTLIAHRSFASHMPQSLAHVGSVYTTTIPWKLKFKSGEEKGAVAGLGVKEEDLAEYNAMDVRVDALCWNRMQRDIEPERAVYELDMKMAALFTEMQIAGIRVDQGRQKDLSAKLKRRAAGLVGEMRSLLDRRLFSPSKPNDIRRALYKQLKAPIWLGPLTPTGLPSTAAIVLEALRKGDNRAGKLADLIIRWRSANDSRSEYLDVYVHTDGRVHPTWKQVETGRPACIAKGTLIETMRDVSKFPKGIPIEDVRVGDYVYCYDHNLKLALRKVTAAQKTGKRSVIRVHWQGSGHQHRGYLDLTPEHEVLLTSGEWRRADRLKRLDRVMALSRDVKRDSGYARLYPSGYDGTLRDHRFVFEQISGLVPEHVHHLNHNKLDNRFVNLGAVTNSEHGRLHGDDPGRRERQRQLAIRLRKEGKFLGPPEPKSGSEHPMWLGLTRVDIVRALKANAWSITKAARAEGRDFNTFKKYVLMAGLDLQAIKRKRIELKWNHEVLHIERITNKVDVYDLSIEECENFIANEICVHNSRNPNVLNIPRMAHCQSCGVKLLDGCVHVAEKRKKRKCPDGVMRLISCDEPQPEEQLRDIYVAAKGHKFVYFDLSQCEMRFAANISNDPKFIEACSGDIHAANACILFPDAAEIIRADPKGRGARFRDVAKNCGFAVTYLAEAPTVYAHLRESGFDVNLSDVETMLRYLHDAYRVYYRYVEKNVSLCRKQGFLRTVFVKRKRWLGFFPTPTTCANFPVQSGVADVMAERLLELEQRRTRGARLLIYHYDAAIYEVPDREVETMERIIAECWKRPVVVPHNELSFVQKIDQKRGERLSDF